MSDFMTALAEMAAVQWNQQAATVLRYVQAKTENLKLLKPPARSWELHWVVSIAEKMSPPPQLTSEEQRFIRAIAQLDSVDRLIEHWFQPALQRGEGAGENYTEILLAAAGIGGAKKILVATAFLQELGSSLQTMSHVPNSAGQFLLDLPTADLAAAAEEAHEVVESLRFLLKHQAARVPELAPSFLIRKSSYGHFLDDKVVDALLTVNAIQYEQLVISAIERHQWSAHQFNAGVQLAKHLPQYLPRARRAAAETLADSNWQQCSEEVCTWLIQQFGVGGLPEVSKFLRDCNNAYYTMPVLKNTVDALGIESRPAALAASENEDARTVLAGAEQLVVWKDARDQAAIVSAILKGLSETTSEIILKYLRLLAAHDLAGLQEHVWKLLDHKSKPVRLAAGRALGRLGEPAVECATKLVGAKKAATRSAAVTLLATAETPAAIAKLEARVDEESDEEVRDQILLALEQVWDKQGKKMSRAEIESRIERAKSKLKDPAASWLDEKKLPPLNFAGPKPEQLAPEQVRYLLYRQSRAKEMRADVEAKPLYELIDRRTSGDFALYVLQSFLGSRMEADDRWALAVAGLLGDDRCVAALMQQIRKWVDSNRGKLAEYAAQALALLGSDVALCAVDALSIRYRNKQKNIGKAAGEAFAEAAERLGVTPDELGDRVVPWLGFEPGQPRLIEQGDKKIEVRIGSDHKLEFRDLVKGKKIGSLPAGISAEVKNEFKDLGVTLREVVKGQLARIENLMVRQFRWPLGRWRELYLQHPLLFPFATQLIWGWYDDQGQLVKAFRALEDRTLTDERDESYELPAAGQIGLVHPLELSPAARQAWGTHLADYNLEPPVLQISRPVVFPQPDELATKISKKYENTDLNAMTFRSRAERLGWQRGSVTDGGGISSYRKGFPGAGADAILELEGMYIGIGMEESIKLGKFSFVKTGSVKFGSYIYDEPANDQDPRLIPFGEVPPIVFSETLGDLAKIAGGKKEEEE